MKKIATSILTLFLLTAAYADPPTKIAANLKWSEETTLQPAEDADTYYISHFEGAYYDELYPTLPLYVNRFLLDSYSEVEAVFFNTLYEPYEKSPSVDDAYLSEQVKIKVDIEKDRSDYFARLSFIPIRTAGPGRYERLVSFEIRLSYRLQPAPVRARGGHTYTSVLSEGDIYKFAVDRAGVYKLDYDFLKTEMGIDIDNVDPRTIKLLGNGGGVLPELVEAERADDLVENAIQIIGEDDGKFDESDYILFYGQGASIWKYDAGNGVFDMPTNYYDAKNYYFIKISTGNGLRISDQQSLAGSTYTSTSFNDFIRYEKEIFNLQHDWSFGQGSGRHFYGDFFKVKVEEDYSSDFQVANLVEDAPAKLKAAFAGRIKSGSFGKYSIKANGNTFVSSNFTPTPGGSVDSYAQERIIDAGFVPNGPFDIQLEFEKGDDPFNEGWLDYIQINFRRRLLMTGDQMVFRDAETLGNAVSTFKLGNASGSTEIWDITDPLHPSKQLFDISGSEISFATSTGTLKEFIAFNSSGYLSAEAISKEKIPNQNLHAFDDVNMVIVYPEEFRSEAERLAQHRTEFSGLKVAMVEVNQLFNEFSSGRKDAGAIRDFAAMLFDRSPEEFKSLLLFGDGSFDSRDIYKLGGGFIPVYETEETLSPIHSYPSDDFFGLLSEGEGAEINLGSLDVGVGRLPVKDIQEAREAVDKIIRYDMTPSSFRDWRNRILFVADDEDGNRHTGDANKIADFIGGKNKNLNVDKIYLDAFPQVSTSGGTRVPLATDALNNNMFKGILAMVYLGHGGTKGWAQERVLKIEDIVSWANKDRMPLIITATCSFSGFDNPAFTTAGELCFLNKKGGAVALYTTVRPVFASANERLTRASIDTLFYKFGTEIPTLGEVLRISKNKVGSASNSRKFLLLGDPAQKLALPNYQVATTKINGHDITTAVIDTIRSLQKVTIEGEVQDDFGNLLTSFNGVVYPTIYDKKVTYQTLAQDEGSPLFNFDLQKNIIFKGRASVANGKFAFTFVVPKDINYDYGACKVSYYASNEAALEDAAGNYQEIIVGGTDPNALADDQGPKVEVFMDDESFVFGGITSADPFLLVNIEDDNGINVVGNAIGHDLIGILDNNSKNFSYTLNDFYEAALNDHTKGKVKFPLNDIPEGRHEIKVTAWDIANNPAEGFTEFVVVSSEKTALEHVLNYPNPFTSSTCFLFELNPNRTGIELDAQVQIYTISGRLIKTLQERIIFEGGRLGSDECIRWDGRDDYGDPLAKGVYIYKVKIKNPGIGQAVIEGESDFEKLVILK
ncbi:MAG TPA: type IX secretion system sortase PorU [Bacteroidetes bacterium]|nr:type IX secretion system sortase PorU [Bacteroidota bacterium]